MSTTRPTPAAARLLDELREARAEGATQEVARLAREASRAGATREEVRSAMGLPSKPQTRARGGRTTDAQDGGTVSTSRESTGVVPTRRRSWSEPTLPAARDGAPAWLAESTHELSNAITAIACIARQAIERGDAASALERILDVCDDAVDALRHFRPSSPPPPLESRADVGLVLEDIRVAMTPMAQAAGVRFEVRTHRELVASIDPSALRSIVWNLAKNAIEAVDRNGNVMVSADADERGVHLIVSDDGPGLTATELARVLEPFATTRTDGMGLGLPIVRRLVNEHGGDLAFDSAPGAGTRVHVTLPPWRSERAPATQPSGFVRRPSSPAERAKPTSSRPRARRG